LAEQQRVVHHRAARRPAWIHLPRVSPAAQSNSRCRAADSDRHHCSHPYWHVHSYTNAVPIPIFDAAAHADGLVACANVNAHGSAVAYIYADPNANGHGHANPDGYAHAHTYTDANPDGHANADPNSNGHSYADADTNSNGHTNTDADTNSHSYGHANTDTNPDSYGHANAHRDADAHADRDAIVFSHGPNADSDALHHGVAVARLAVRQWITCLPSSRG
jgi:hypothetical protein